MVTWGASKPCWFDRDI